MAVKVLSKTPPQSDERTIKDTGNDDDRKSPVYMMEERETMSTRVYVGNLGYDVDDRDLYYFFYQFGPVEHARIIVYRSGFSKGFGFVTFHGAEVAKSVIEMSKKDNIWMNGRMLRIGAARQARRKLDDKYFDNNMKVSENVDTSGTSPTVCQVFTENNGSSADFGITSNQLLCCPNQPSYYLPPYHQLSGQDMSYYPSPWHNMSYPRTQPYHVPIPLAHVDTPYSTYQYQGAFLADQPSFEPYWEHQDNHMFMVTYDTTQPGLAQCGRRMEHLTPSDNYQEAFQGPEITYGDDFHQSDPVSRTDYTDTQYMFNTQDSYLCDSGYHDSIMQAGVSQVQGQLTTVSIVYDEADYKNKREDMEEELKTNTDPFQIEESMDQVGGPSIVEVPTKNYEICKGEEGNVLNKNMAVNEMADCRKDKNNDCSEDPCLENQSNMMPLQSSLEKLEIKCCQEVDSK